jgi:hypothetical protein
MYHGNNFYRSSTLKSFEMWKALDTT